MMLRLTTLLAVLLCLAGCGRIANHPIVGVAKDEVSKNSRVIELLGGPIEFSPTVNGRANETDGIAAMQFEAKGPKGNGLVVVEGKKLGQEWGVTLLEVRPAGGGDHLHLTADLEERTGTDTPKFDPSAATNTPAASSAPPPGDIEIALPPGVPTP
jgi:hypothetical protein